MKTIYHFKKQQLIVINSYSATLMSNHLQVIDSLEYASQLSAQELVQDNDGKLYFSTTTGLVAFSQAYFRNFNFFHEVKLYPQSKWGRIKRSHGSQLYSDQHQLLDHLPLKSPVQIIGNGYDLFHQPWLKTIDGGWLKQADIWLDNEPLITHQHDLIQQATMVINPQGTCCFNQAGQPINIIPAKTKFKVLAVMDDQFGNEFLQVGENKFLPTTDCLLGQLPAELPNQDLWQLPTENINQMFWQIENGCEAAALLMGLHYHHHLESTDYQSFIDKMPIAPDYNPYHGFGGSPYKNVKGRFEAIFPPALLRWGRNYTYLRDLTGVTESGLITALKRGNPVLVYVTINFDKPEPDTYPWGKTYKNNHAALLDGFSQDLFHVSDPINGHYWISKQQFGQAYQVRKWAIEIY
ncbi:C39 family peptidase [Lactobacillus sp. ESL0684]|uniref:C39 family peptidase n=1 Tax=Lactobacillus sp. ESL0684 TaxID=2983213 RepID=UPI0023FA29C7|nr:C39 family peptidase [Lactobacillus sp. ESL0684]WEV43755.1 C39 family peptidase [Lactobacillus sp. ESL0684]